jgi:cysteine desulfurase/selenocysteine lyase
MVTSADPATIDVARARAQTPGTAHVTHLNNAGTALPPRPVTDAVIEHLRREATIGGYEAADAAAEQIENVPTAVARLLSCRPTEIAIVENATRAWDMAFYSLPFEPGDRILTGRSEYASNAIALLQTSRRTGARIEVIEDDESGQIDLAELERRIDADVKLISLTHVPTQSGLVNPAAEVGRLARAAGVPFLLDACQSAGQLPLDVEELGCDLLSATGRKYLRGPRGTGFLYARHGFLESLEPPFLDLHSAEWTSPDEYEVVPDARRFESWEGNVAAKIGLGVAVDYALSWGLAAIEARVTGLAARLRAQLAELPGVRVHDHGRRLCGLVTFTVDGVGAGEVVARLRVLAINTSVSASTSSQYDLPHRGLSEVVRASVHYYNTEDELTRLVEALGKTSMR